MYAQLLRQVRDSLTPENWNKGSYFKVKENKMCMCVHGAVQALVNPQVQEALKIENKYAAVQSAVGIISGTPAGVAISAAIAHFSKSKSLHETWKYRHTYSEYVAQNYIYDNKNYGNTNLHWLMGMLGITYMFNDDPTTSLEMLREKLTVAAKWAEENEEFLLNN